MKQINYIKTLFLSALVGGLGTFTACNDAEYGTLGTHAYIAESLAATSGTVNLQISGETTTVLNIHVSDLVDTDSHYKLVSDPSVLDEYNRINGTSYIVLPDGQYTLPEDIVVKAGEYNAEASVITLKAFTEEMMKSGESYALPVRLISKDGTVPAMPNTGTYVILASSIMEFPVPMFTNGANLFSQSYIDNPETYAQYTVEVRFQVSNTSNRNRAVFSTNDGADRYVLLRFEDPQSYDSEHKWEAHSLVQIQLHEGMYVNPSNNFQSNKWQHLAVTFDGSTYRIYVNGIESGTLACSTPCTTFTSINWFTDGDGNQKGWWSGCNVLVSEARIWSVARSAAQIANSMTQVSPKSAGLEAYWRMNEGEGNTFQDATGKGHTLTTSQMPKWIEGVLSTDESTPWE